MKLVMNPKGVQDINTVENICKILSLNTFHFAGQTCYETCDEP